MINLKILMNLTELQFFRPTTIKNTALLNLMLDLKNFRYSD